MNLSKKVFNNPTIHHELADLCNTNVDSDSKPAPLKEQVLLQSVPMLLNSAAKMIGLAPVPKPVLFNLCDQSQFNK